jgi:DNA (cytosine-5)-methyltransferase 1
MRFVDLFAGLGGFHRALSHLGHECVFACELDAELRELYAENFPRMRGKVFGDIQAAKGHVPSHDILCAGFPCQPFSKSGSQLGTKDETRGTLFQEILDVIDLRMPKFLILENVGNFARHDNGRTWRIVREKLEGRGYFVAGTEHVNPRLPFDWRDLRRVVSQQESCSESTSVSKSGGVGLLSPHHFGEPQHRERFFIIASLEPLPAEPFPQRRADLVTSIESITQLRREIRAAEWRDCQLTAQQIRCIDLWNGLIRKFPQSVSLPSYPIWADELRARYPFEKATPFASSDDELRRSLRVRSPYFPREQLLEKLPSYAREEVEEFREWKKKLIRSNRRWWQEVANHIPKGWQREIGELPSSLRKLEWNMKGERRDLWNHILQFRPSGLRVRRFNCAPALVAMTTTQIPILGPKHRAITRTEGLRLQGFPDHHQLPISRAAAFRALGNAVHVVVAEAVAAKLLQPSDVRSKHGSAESRSRKIAA